MINICEAFNGKKAFIAYLMAGDPSLEASARNILAVQEAGADLIQIGIPFSDPIAEGEEIQAASVRAISAGTRLDGVFRMVDSIKARLRVPIVFATYLNPVFVYGYERFFSQCALLGVSGVIIPDMPYEEQGEAKLAAQRHGVEVIALLAPTSAGRTGMIAREAKGFVYMAPPVAAMSAQGEITGELGSMLASVRESTSTPVAIGLGVCTPEQAALYSAVADGIIAKSAIVRIIAEYGELAGRELQRYVREMKCVMG